jgi:Protein of unknown function (DUF3987)
VEAFELPSGNNIAAMKAYTAELDAFKLRRKNSDLELGDAPEKPALIRYRTNDSSYESLGELLIDNPTGMLVERDELISLLNHLDREDKVSLAVSIYRVGLGLSPIHSIVSVAVTGTSRRSASRSWVTLNQPRSLNISVVQI